MPATSFATADELRVFIGGATIDPSRAQTLVDYASAIVRRFTGQVLSVVIGEVETFKPTSRDVLILSERPVTAITQVLVDGVAFVDFNFSIIGAVKKDDELSWDKGATITYNHGYVSTSDEFQSVKSITLQIAARALTMNKAPEFDEFSRTTSESSGFAPDVIVWPAEKQLLSDFGKVLVG